MLDYFLRGIYYFSGEDFFSESFILGVGDLMINKIVLDFFFRELVV